MTVGLPAGDRGRGRARHRRAGDRGHRLGRRRSTGSSTSRRPRWPGSSSSTPGSGCSATTSASTSSAACPRRCGSSRCGRRCCRTRRCWRCCGSCTPATPTCCPPTWTSPACSPSTSASPGSAARAPTSRSSRPACEVATGGVYGEEGYVYQLFDPLPEFDGFRPALGAWIVGDEAAGLGIRETVGLVTDDGAAFVPHRIPAVSPLPRRPCTPVDHVAAAIGPGFFSLIGRGVGAILLYAVLGVLLMLLGFWAIDITTPGKLNRMVREGLPNAVLVTAAGMVSMAFIVVTAIYTLVRLAGRGPARRADLRAGRHRRPGRRGAAAGVGDRHPDRRGAAVGGAASPRRGWWRRRTWRWGWSWRWRSSDRRPGAAQAAGR